MFVELVSFRHNIFCIESVFYGKYNDLFQWEIRIRNTFFFISSRKYGPPGRISLQKQGLLWLSSAAKFIV